MRRGFDLSRFASFSVELLYFSLIRFAPVSLDFIFVKTRITTCFDNDVTKVLNTRASGRKICGAWLEYAG